MEITEKADYIVQDVAGNGNCGFKYDSFTDLILSENKLG